MLYTQVSAINILTGEVQKQAVQNETAIYVTMDELQQGARLLPIAQGDDPEAINSFCLQQIICDQDGVSMLNYMDPENQTSQPGQMKPVYD